MPRGARISIENAFYHVFNRGLNKQNIFSDNADYLTFLKRLVTLKKEKEFDHSIYAYVLMPNHFHLLIQTRKISLSKIMTSLLTSYSMYFNKKYERVGILFQNRFKSKLCDKETYLLGASRYILLNPLEANIVSDLSQYYWSSYQDMFENPKIKVVEDEEQKELINFTGMDKNQYFKFIQEGIQIIDDLRKDYTFDKEIGGSNLFNTRTQKKYLRRRLKSV